MRENRVKRFQGLSIETEFHIFRQQKFKTMNRGIISLAFAGLLLVMLTSCNSGESNGESGDTDSTTVLKSEPIGKVNEEVNALPNESFNKKMEKQEQAFEMPETNLSPVDAKLPEKVDAILSRESIVIFSQRIMEEMPDEMEFSQVSQQVFAGPDNWNAFMVRYITRPGNVNMVIFGAYQGENQILWGSDLGNATEDYAFTAIAPADGGVDLFGKMEDGRAFKLSLSSGSLNLITSP